MTRLPIVGGDVGDWGTILNDYLQVSLNSDGTIQSGALSASQVTNAADKSSTSLQTFAGNLSAPALGAAGLTGATAASRYVGATTSGAPASGTFAVGDFCVDQTGTIRVCTSAGTPGAWVPVGASGLVLPSGDTTGATDSAAIIHALAAGTVRLLPGSTFYLSGPVAMTTQGSILDLGGSTIQPGSGWSGSEMVGITAANCIVRNGYFYGGSGTTASNPTCNAIELTAAPFSRVEDIRFSNVNGWCVESNCASGSGYGTVLGRLYGLQNAGGIHILGASLTTQHNITDINFQQTGVASGANANLDVLKLEDAEDILVENFQGGISDAGTGSTLHIHGHCASNYFTNLDLGTYPNGSGSNSVCLIEDGANGSPADIRITNFVFQQGSVGLTYTGAGSKLRFANGRCEANYTHGAVISGSGSEIIFDDCEFGGNGAGASGTNYDLNWSGTATGYVTNTAFMSAVTASGTGGVQNVVNFSNAEENVPFNGCRFLGSGTTPGNAFVHKPIWIRNCEGFNPWGSITVTVPASGSPTAKVQFDTWFYITNNQASAITVAISGTENGLTATIPASVTMPVFVPASQTLTPTYTTAPAWVVYGV